MYFNKDRKDTDEEVKKNVVVNKSMMVQKNKKYVKNMKQSSYNMKYVNKFYKRNSNISTFNNNNFTFMNFNNLKVENKNSQHVYFNRNSNFNNNIKDNIRSSIYSNKQNYFDQDNINYNTLINSQTCVCSIHIDKTDDDISKQQNIINNVHLYNDLNHSSKNSYPIFMEQINFTDNIVLLTGILILPYNDKIFNNLEFEGKTNPIPAECNLSIYVNVVNQYDSHYFKQLYKLSYNFKNRLLFAATNNDTIDSSLLIDQIIIKGNFKNLSLIVLGQIENVPEALR